MAATALMGTSADARPGHGVRGRGPAGHSVHAGHRGTAPRVHRRVGVRRTGVHRTGVHRVGVHRVGVRRPITARRRVIVKHRSFVRRAGHFKRFGKNYHLRHGKRFRFGWYFKGFWHRHWTRCVWNPRYRTYCYWCPCTLQWYYWCQPQGCYYPVTYCPTGTYNYDYSGPAADDAAATAGPNAAGPVDDPNANGPGSDSDSDE
jgi:hypothetical protein